MFKMCIFQPRSICQKCIFATTIRELFAQKTLCISLSDFQNSIFQFDFKWGRPRFQIWNGVVRRLATLGGVEEDAKFSANHLEARVPNIAKIFEKVANKNQVWKCKTKHIKLWNIIVAAKTAKFIRNLNLSNGKNEFAFYANLSLQITQFSCF